MSRASLWVLASLGPGLTPVSSAAPAACTVTVGYRTMEISGRVVALWYPTAARARDYAYGPNFSSVLAVNAPAARACGERVPLVVFSHGDLGCAVQSVVLTEELARHGYVVAAPDHADAALCHTVPPATAAGSGSQPPQPPILSPDRWSDSSRIDRRRDIEDVLDAVLADRELAAVIDPARIGLAGHSLGGYTVVGVAGGWPSWRDARVRAVLALSPYVMPFQVKGTLGAVGVPIMYQGGTLDAGITPFLEGPRGAFAAAKSPAYLLILRGAGHFAWVNCGHEHTTRGCLGQVTNARLATEYGIAFFDRYLKASPAPILDHPEEGVARLRTK